MPPHVVVEFEQVTVNSCALLAALRADEPALNKSVVWFVPERLL